MKPQQKQISMSNINGGTRTENVYADETKKQTAESHVTIDVTVRVTYRAPADDAYYLRQRVNFAAMDLLDSDRLDQPANGTDKSKAVLVSAVAEVVKPVKPALTEDEIVDYYRRRIEDGHLLFEELPRYMARTGLQSPSAFVDEIAERIQMATDDAAEENDWTVISMNPFYLRSHHSRKQVGNFDEGSQPRFEKGAFAYFEGRESENVRAGVYQIALIKSPSGETVDRAAEYGDEVWLASGDKFDMTPIKVSLATKGLWAIDEVETVDFTVCDEVDIVIAKVVFSDGRELHRRVHAKNLWPLTKEEFDAITAGRNNPTPEEGAPTP